MSLEGSHWACNPRPQVFEVLEVHACQVREGGPVPGWLSRQVAWPGVSGGWRRRRSRRSLRVRVQEAPAGRRDGAVPEHGPARRGDVRLSLDPLHDGRLERHEAALAAQQRVRHADGAATRPGHVDAGLRLDRRLPPASVTGPVTAAAGHTRPRASVSSTALLAWSAAVSPVLVHSVDGLVLTHHRDLGFGHTHSGNQQVRKFGRQRGGRRLG